MPKQFRRFEFLLPTRFNNGDLVPSEAFAETLLELETQFGAVSSESQTIAGRWHHEGQLYRDESVRVFVDVPDLDTNRNSSSISKSDSRSASNKSTFGLRPIRWK